MIKQENSPRFPLPRGWLQSVKSAMLHVISLAVPPKNLIHEELRGRVRTNVDSDVIGGLKIAPFWHIKRPIQR